MKRILNNIFAVVTGAAVLFAAGCDSTYVKEIEAAKPVVESFTPAAAPVGAEIVITGQNLNDVVKAYIGGVEMTIKEKVSDTRMSIIAGAAGKDGKITLENATGKGESADAFVYSYAVPSVKTALLQAEVDMGSRLLISGTNLSSVASVIFTAEGYSVGHAGDIVERSASELLVRVPYVEADAARITLSYFDGSKTVETPLASAPSVAINRNKPVFDAVTLSRTAVGRTVTLTGVYMDKVDKILVNGFEAVISKQPTKLVFSVPAGDFADGDTTTTLVAEYFDGNETLELSNSFVVFVPFVKFWEGIKTFGRVRTAEAQASMFFTPDDGSVYATSDWRTKVDPISYKYQAKTCSVANVPNKGTGGVSEAEYLSVKPYFFIAGGSAGPLSITCPANSATILRNIYTTTSGSDVDFRITGSAGDTFGTPVLKYRFLDPTNATENAIIQKVKNQTLEKIDEAEFPIDVTAKTVAGVGITSASGSLSSDIWAKGSFEPGKEKLDVKVDAVVMVLYYNYNGAGTGMNFAENILRIGFIHITNVNYRQMSANDSGASDWTFNCYWQKYDYDYSKL